MNVDAIDVDVDVDVDAYHIHGDGSLGNAMLRREANCDYHAYDFHEMDAECSVSRGNQAKGREMVMEKASESKCYFFDH
jgi:hypothetical protein